MGSHFFITRDSMERRRLVENKKSLGAANKSHAERLLGSLGVEVGSGGVETGST